MRVPLFVFFLLPCLSAFSQGCSDAGFCSLGGFKPQPADSILEKTSRLKAGLSYGTADHSISVLASYLDYSIKLNDKFSLDGRLTSTLQSGNDISSFGLSDYYLNAGLRPVRALLLTAGIKLPLTDGNKKMDGIPLPMDYQPSLGTIDLVAGVSYVLGKFQLVAAWQQPLSQNENAFFAENFPPESVLREFQSTNGFQRNGDVLLRASYPMQLGGKWRLTPGILPIYHLANDRYKDASGLEKEITGSQGLTLNINLFADVEVNAVSDLQISASVPVVVRDARPDGLTRHFVLSLEYALIF